MQRLPAAHAGVGAGMQVRRRAPIPCAIAIVGDARAKHSTAVGTQFSTSHPGVRELGARGDAQPGAESGGGATWAGVNLSLIHISEPTRLALI
eukprot:8771386-Alexandrium_andersonii.AAC.1